MNRGAFDFLTKPIDFADLETTIAKTLRHLEVLREARRRQAAAERAHASLSRYFSPNLAERLAGDARRVEPRRRSGARWRRCSPTSPASPPWSRRSSPSVLGELLNDYLAGMTDIVFAHDGTVAKIIGDALHVLFGAPGDQPDHAAARGRLRARARRLRAIVPRRRGAERASRSAPPASASMPARRSSAISAAAASSTTRPMATRSTSRRGSKPPTSSSARASASAPLPRGRRRIFAAGRSATSSSEVARATSRFRAAATRAMGRRLDGGLPRGLCQVGSRRSRRSCRFCSPNRQAAG